MKLSAIAIDYDGTIASNDILDPSVRDAIADVRGRGILVVLTTGRRLDDLRRVAGDLTTFDIVVAENGAVLEFPASGRHGLLAHPPSPSFLDELRRRRVEFAAGECVVETDAASAPIVLEIVRTLELPLILAFNRSRLMILPQGIAKSTGLRQALRAVRVSTHNTIGIGDAENDHDLLDACEVGVAVEWGSPSLKAVADEIILGSGPAAVAPYLTRVAGQRRLSCEQMGRRHLMLGHDFDGRPVRLAVRGRTILIGGEPGTGKSWLAGLLCEQLILQGYSVCIIDPEGDYRSLEALPSVLMLGGDDPPPSARELTRALQYSDVSLVIDLSRISHHAKVEYVQALMPLLATLRRSTGLPHKILLDEAHYFLNGAQHASLIDPELAGYIIVTYRISALDPAVRPPSDTVVLVTRETDPEEVDVLTSMCRPQPDADRSSRMCAELEANEAVLLPGPTESGGTMRRFALGPRLTEHVRHRSKYLDMPIAEAHAFVFTDGNRGGPRARTLKEFVGLLSTMPAARLEGHLRRHDFSRWIDDVFRDRPLAARIRSLEQQAGLADTQAVAVQAIAQAIRARYETVPGGVGPSSFDASAPLASADQAPRVPGGRPPVVVH